MPKVKPITALKQRLHEALTDLAQLEEIIELVQKSVELYNLTPTDVFELDVLEAAVSRQPVDESIRYYDRAGNTWNGTGRRPRWLTDAIDSGAVLEDFRNPNYRAVTMQVDPFRDDDGNTWSGKGRRPTWLTEALAAGADLEDFRNPAYRGR